MGVTATPWPERARPPSLPTGFVSTLLLLGAKRELLLYFIFFFTSDLHELHSSLCHEPPPKLVIYIQPSLMDAIFMLVYVFKLNSVPKRLFKRKRKRKATITSFGLEQECVFGRLLSSRRSFSCGNRFSRLGRPALASHACSLQPRVHVSVHLSGKTIRWAAPEQLSLLAGGGVCSLVSPAHELLMRNLKR